MSFFLNLSKRKKLSEVVRKNRLLKALVKSAYKTVTFPFTRNGVEINIGGAGNYRLDHNFTFMRYDEFGNRHNSGFWKWIDCCREKTVVFDVGAHIGLYTLPAAGVVAKSGVVYAFEPSEANRKYLKRHLEYNKINNVEILPYVVGEAANKAQVFYESMETNPMNSINPAKNPGSYRRVIKEQISIDEFAFKNSVQPEVIKIDVEGAERNVLRGASEIIKKYSPVIFLSAHPKQLPLCGASIEKLEGIILQLGYHVLNHNGAEVKNIEFGEYILLPRGRSLIW